MARISMILNAFFMRHSKLVNKLVNEGSTKAEKERRVTSIDIVRYACETSLD